MIEVLFWIYVASALICLSVTIKDLVINGQEIRNNIKLKPWGYGDTDSAFCRVFMCCALASMIPVLNTVLVMTIFLVRMQEMIAKDS